MLEVKLICTYIYVRITNLPMACAIFFEIGPPFCIILLNFLDNFCTVRFEYYEKRKRHQIDALEKEIRYLGNKERFVSEVVSKTINIMNENESDIISVLKERNYDRAM